MLIDFGTVVRENNQTDQKYFLTAGKEFSQFLLAPEHSNGNPTRQSDLFSLGKLARDRIEYNEKKGKKMQISSLYRDLISNLCRDQIVPQESLFNTAREALEYLYKHHGKEQIVQKGSQEDTILLPKKIDLQFGNFMEKIDLDFQQFLKESQKK